MRRRGRQKREGARISARTGATLSSVVGHNDLRRILAPLALSIELNVHGLRAVSILD